MHQLKQADKAERILPSEGESNEQGWNQEVQVVCVLGGWRCVIVSLFSKIKVGREGGRRLS